MAGNSNQVNQGEMAQIPAQLTVAQDQTTVQHQAVLRDMVDIESKVIWELENWKRAEEARFRYNLKQKEAELAEKMRAEWKQKELDREKAFKETENKMAGHLQRMQSKMNQLQKRESRLVLLEEELKQKISETSRQLALKDAEADEFKQKMLDEKKLQSKKIKELEEKNKKLEEIGKGLEEDLRLNRIEQERSPIELVKKELNDRLMEISQLKKEVEKTDEIKEEYRKHFDRLKDEVLKLKRERDQAIMEANTKHDKDIQLLRNQLGQITGGGAGPNFNSLRDELFRIKGGTGGADLQNLPTNIQGKQPYSNTLPVPQNALSSPVAPRFSADTGRPDKNFTHSGTYTDPQDISNYARLKQEKAALLRQGYQETDQLVQQVEAALKNMREQA